jgi:hypothetical protein
LVKTISLTTSIVENGGSAPNLYAIIMGRCWFVFKKSHKLCSINETYLGVQNDWKNMTGSKYFSVIYPKFKWNLKGSRKSVLNDIIDFSQ